MAIVFLCIAVFLELHSYHKTYWKFLPESRESDSVQLWFWLVYLSLLARQIGHSAVIHHIISGQNDKNDRKPEDTRIRFEKKTPRTAK